MSVQVAAAGIAAEVDAIGGFLTFRVEDGGRVIDMLHRAPWIGRDEAFPGDMPAHLAGLRGDFFCAPFSDASRESAPLHGWTANGVWAPLETEPESGGASACWRLKRLALGAEVFKQVTLRDGHPFVYQKHVFRGGAGRWPVANHAMIAVGEGAIVSASSKRAWVTPPDALESDPAMGRSWLTYPALADGPGTFPAAGGGTADLGRLPFAEAHEDFVIAVEDAASRLAWTAVVRPAQGDLYLSLKDARRLPLTMFWHSNGGRRYAPWNSRHTGVLGVEEGVGFDEGFLPETLRAAMRSDGQPLALALSADRTTEVRHAIGQIDWPSGARVADIRLAGGTVEIEGEDGSRRDIPVWKGFLPES